MSSIMASRLPGAGVPPTSGTGRGVLSSVSMPIDWASRRAGSMVSTTTLRPRSAARRARAAEVVVLPTPPAPQHTMMRVPGSSSSASMSRGPAWSPVGGERADPRAGSLCHGSCQSLGLEERGQLVEAAEVDAAGKAGELVRRHVQVGDQHALAVLERPPLGVVAGLDQQAVEELVVDVEPGRAELLAERLPVEVAGARRREVLAAEVARPERG